MELYKRNAYSTEELNLYLKTNFKDFFRQGEKDQCLIFHDQTFHIFLITDKFSEIYDNVKYAKKVLEWIAKFLYDYHDITNLHQIKVTYFAVKHIPHLKDVYHTIIL